MATFEFNTLTTIAVKELQDAKRNRWFILFTAIFACLSLMLSLSGSWSMGRLGISGFSRTAASLSNLVVLIVPLMGLLLGAISITGEREKGTLEIMMAQPVVPMEVILGKWLGLAGVLTAAVLFGFGISGMIIASSTTEQIGSYLKLLAFTLLLGYAHLSVGMLVSASVGRTATSVSVALLLWLFVVLISDLGLMGTAVVLKMKPQNLFWLTLLNPAQTFRIAVLQSLQGNLDLLGASGAYAADVLGKWLIPTLSLWLVFWMIVPVSIALLVFHYRGENRR